jgi:hypothetical protein
MEKLIQMPKQVRPFALSARPAQPGCISKFVLIATAWNSDEAATTHGFVEMADLVDELADLGADRTMKESVIRALEAGRACVIPKLWLTPPQVELLKIPVKRSGLLRAFPESADGAQLAKPGPASPRRAIGPR